MNHRLVFATLLLAFIITELHAHSSFAQTPDTEMPPVSESLPPSFEPPDVSTTPVPTDGRRPPESVPQEQTDAVVALGELRNAVHAVPNNPDARLKLAQGLYRIGDLDTALDECR